MSFILLLGCRALGALLRDINKHLCKQIYLRITKFRSEMDLGLSQFAEEETEDTKWFFKDLQVVT